MAGRNRWKAAAPRRAIPASGASLLVTSPPQPLSLSADLRGRQRDRQRKENKQKESSVPEVVRSSGFVFAPRVRAWILGINCSAGARLFLYSPHVWYGNMVWYSGCFLPPPCFEFRHTDLPFFTCPPELMCILPNVRALQRMTIHKHGLTNSRFVHMHALLAVFFSLSILFFL